METTCQLLSNHAGALFLLASYGRITTREIANRLHVAERSVLRMVKDMESEGYICRIKVGRRNRYVVHLDKPLRRPEHFGVTTGQLLRILGVHVDSHEPAPNSADSLTS